MNRARISLLLILISSTVFAQVGGNNTYEFLNLITSARSSSLGGNLISIKDGDLNLTAENPAMIDSSMNNQLALNYVNYIGDINYGYVAYARNLKKIGTTSFGMHYINYGKFTGALDNSDITGEFSVGEYSFTMGTSRELSTNFFVGANAKLIYSGFEEYKSFGGAFDLAGVYHLAEEAFTAGLVIKNIGIQFKPYTKGNNEKLPFEIEAGLSHKLKKAPIRFVLTGKNFQRFDLSYSNPDSVETTTVPVLDEEGKAINPFFDKLFRHFNVGSEFLLTKNFMIRLGYNYHRRQDLKVVTKKGLSGFSLGVGLKIYKFHLSYSKAWYHQAGGTNTISAAIRMNDFYSKK